MKQLCFFVVLVIGLSLASCKKEQTNSADPTLEVPPSVISVTVDKSLGANQADVSRKVETSKAVPVAPAAAPASAPANGQTGNPEMSPNAPAGGPATTAAGPGAAPK